MKLEELENGRLIEVSIKGVGELVEIIKEQAAKIKELEKGPWPLHIFNTLDRYEKALKFYADESNYDDGFEWAAEIARKALKSEDKW